MVSTPGDGTYHGALPLNIREVTRRLNSALGGTLVASLASADDLRLSHEWARADGPMPSAGAAERLRFAYEQWRKVSDAEGDEVARAWFTGANPWLQDDTPVNAIRRHQLASVAAAARAFVDEAFSG